MQALRREVQVGWSIEHAAVSRTVLFKLVSAFFRFKCAFASGIIQVEQAKKQKKQLEKKLLDQQKRQEEQLQVIFYAYARRNLSEVCQHSLALFTFIRLASIWSRRLRLRNILRNWYDLVHCGKIMNGQYLVDPYNLRIISGLKIPVKTPIVLRRSGFLQTLLASPWAWKDLRMTRSLESGQLFLLPLTLTTTSSASSKPRAKSTVA